MLFVQEDDGDSYMGSPADSPGATGLNRSQSSPNIAKVCNINIIPKLFMRL